MGLIKVRILNWDKYNEKRKDVTNPTWLRLQNTMPQSMSLFGVPAAERYVFDCLLCLASQKQEEDIEFDPEWFQTVFCGGCFDIETFHRALGLLHGRVIDVTSGLEAGDVTSTSRPRNEHVTSTSRPRNVDVSLQDGQDEQDKTRQDSKRSSERTASPSVAEAKKTEILLFEPDRVVTEFLIRAQIRASTLSHWRHTYADDEWLRLEILKAVGWLDANPHKKPKSNYARFLGNWLSSGWERYRKTLKSEPASNGEASAKLLEKRLREQGLGDNHDASKIHGANTLA